MMLSEPPINPDARSGETGQRYVTAQVGDVDLTITTNGLDMDVALDFGWRSGS